MKNIIITGANRGIGLEFVKKLTSGSFPTKNIFAACRKPQEAKELQDIKSKSQNVNVHILQLDITDNSQIASATKQVESVVGSEGLNVLINNAGYFNRTKASAIPTIDPEETAKHFATNTTGPILMTQAFLPLLKTAASSVEGGMSCQKAAVINISSSIGSIQQITGKMMFPMLPYRASKTALNSAMRTISQEIKEQGILVVLFCPGWVKTDMGGPQAMITTDKSISDMLKTMAKLNESHTGAFITKDGKPVPW